MKQVIAQICLLPTARLSGWLKRMNNHPAGNVAELFRSLLRFRKAEATFLSACMASRLFIADMPVGVH